LNVITDIGKLSFPLCQQMLHTMQIAVIESCMSLFICSSFTTSLLAEGSLVPDVS